MKEYSVAEHGVDMRLAVVSWLVSVMLVFGKVEMDYADMFVIRSQSATRGHSWKLFPRHCRTTSRKHFFL